MPNRFQGAARDSLLLCVIFVVKYFNNNLDLLIFDYFFKFYLLNKVELIFFLHFVLG